MFVEQPLALPGSANKETAHGSFARLSKRQPPKYSAVDTPVSKIPEPIQKISDARMCRESKYSEP